MVIYIYLPSNAPDFEFSTINPFSCVFPKQQRDEKILREENGENIW